MNEWKDIKNGLPKSHNEVRCFILVSEEHERLSSWFADYETRVKVAWWKGQCGCFAFEDVENMNHAVTHYMMFPEDPEIK